MSHDLRALRDVAIQALAGPADPCNARGVIDMALETLRSELFMLALAVDTVGPNGLEMYKQVLHSMSERTQALAIFSSNYLAIEFAPLKQGGGS